MSKLARTIIKTPMNVEVKNFQQLDESLGVISFLKDKIRYDDIYNIRNQQTMDNLILVRTGKKVVASIGPDSRDADTHPECLSAVVS